MLPPIVTGISPIQGPPGTRVTIRGEHLGTDARDLIGLFICGTDCLLSAEWKSSNKIIARSGPGKGQGDIIVLTKSGGEGTSTVQFKGYYEKTGPLKESAVWVDEDTPTTLTAQLHNIIHEDPLGLSDEGCDKQIPIDELQDLFPDGSGNLKSDNFVPAWWLLENHHQTSYDDLRRGLEYLRRKVDTQNEGQISFLKSNISAILEQLSIMQTLKSKFEADVTTYGSDPATPIQKAIHASKVEADKLFKEVLGRKDKADATRNALAVLTKFRFLFNLPHTMDMNIEKGEFGAVINDYARAKQLFSHTEVKLFQKILLEVDIRVNSLQDILWRQLREVPAPLETHRKLIKNLLNLEVRDDPLLECLRAQHKYDLDCLYACKDQFNNKSHNFAIPAVITSDSFGDDGIIDEEDVLRISFLLELSSLFSENLEMIWKIGQAYIDREFHMDVTQINIDFFHSMAEEEVNLFISFIKAAFLRVSGEDVDIEYGYWGPILEFSKISKYLPKCLTALNDILNQMDRMKMPSNIIKQYNQLMVHFRLTLTRLMLFDCCKKVERLSTLEKWTLTFDDKSGATTKLPTLFETILIDLVKQLFSEDIYCDSKAVQQQILPEVTNMVTDNMKNLLKIFVKVLYTLTEGIQEELRHKEKYSLEKTTGKTHPIKRGAIYSEKNKGTIYEPPKKILVLISNIEYTIKVIIPRIESFFLNNNFRIDKVVYQGTCTSLRELESILQDMYVDTQSLPLLEVIEVGMYFGNFNWQRCDKACDVRHYIKDVIIGLIGVFSEVSYYSPSQCRSLLTAVIENIIIVFHRLLGRDAGESVSRYGYIQMYVDVHGLGDTLTNYLGVKSRKLLAEIHSQINIPQRSEDLNSANKILENFRNQMKLYISCFALN